MLGHHAEQLVKTLNLFRERVEGFGPVMPTDEESARVTKHTRHVTDQLRGRAHAFAGTKRAKVVRRFAQRFLRAISKRRQEVVQQFSPVFHRSYL